MFKGWVRRNSKSAPVGTAIVSPFLSINSVRRDAPPGIGVVGAELSRDLGGIHPEILLMHAALLVDDESHDARVSIDGGPCEQGKAADHVLVDNVVIFASGRIV